jgi:DNA repair photolyase
MRWDTLSAQGSGRAASATPPLPLALPGAVTRTFDTPAFAGMTFYEVRAKSIINRVPAVSRVPFEWTINPYRGCSHACTYCLAGDTPVLMADGRTKPIGSLAVGDRVYGTQRSGNYRRYVVTEVTAHWSTVRPAYRVTLADGTELVASGDHKFLTERGWKHVTGTMGGNDQRPHLTGGNKLMGVGRFAAHPDESPDYRLGYLYGMSRGEAGVTDAEALARTRRYLAEVDPETARLAAAGRLAAPPPDRITTDWRKGFLAGVFDAEGTHDGGALRISSVDRETIDRAAAALRRLDVDFVVRRNGQTRGWYLRVVGGLAARLRFLHTVDPAASRKRSIEGMAIKSSVPLDVVSVERLGLEMPLFDITTGTGDFIADGVVSHNCFARNTHTYLDLDAGADFDRQIVVKVNVARVLARELRAPRWAREPVAMGTNTDPYQRAEGRYRLMPGVIDALARSGTPFSVLTKGTLLARDLPRLVAAAADVPVGLGVSVALLDRPLQARLEPGTPTPAARLDLVRRIADAGLPCGVLVAPVLPLLTDSAEALDALLARIAAAGATGATVLALHLRPGTREWFLAWLAREHPALVDRYHRLYHRGSYVDAGYRRALAERVAPLLRRHGLTGAVSTMRGGPATGGPPPAPAGGEQLSLL